MNKMYTQNDVTQELKYLMLASIVSVFNVRQMAYFTNITYEHASVVVHTLKRKGYIKPVITGSHVLKGIFRITKAGIDFFIQHISLFDFPDTYEDSLTESLSHRSARCTSNSVDHLLAINDHALDLYQRDCLDRLTWSSPTIPLGTGGKAKLYPDAKIEIRNMSYYIEQDMMTAPIRVILDKFWSYSRVISPSDDFNLVYSVDDALSKVYPVKSTSLKKGKENPTEKTFTFESIFDLFECPPPTNKALPHVGDDKTLQVKALQNKERINKRISKISTTLLEIATKESYMRSSHEQDIHRWILTHDLYLNSIHNNCSLIATLSRGISWAYKAAIAVATKSGIPVEQFSFRLAKQPDFPKYSSDFFSTYSYKWSNAESSRYCHIDSIVDNNVAAMYRVIHNLTVCSYCPGSLNQIIATKKNHPWIDIIDKQIAKVAPKRVTVNYIYID